MMRQPGMDLGSGRFHRVRFELTEALTAGGSAAAKVVVWDPSTMAYAVTNHVIEVVDSVEVFSGEIGDRGQATWWGDRRQYEVDAMQAEAAEAPSTQARWITFILPSGGLSTSDATLAGVTVATSWDGTAPVGTVTLRNPTTRDTGVYRYDGDEGDHGEACYDPVNNQYVITGKECS